MECKFYIGQRVTLREPYSDLRENITFPIFGEIYRIREIFMDTVRDRVGVTLEEIRHAPQDLADGYREPGFYYAIFRPVTDISIFTKMLADDCVPA